MSNCGYDRIGISYEAANLYPFEQVWFYRVQGHLKQMLPYENSFGNFFCFELEMFNSLDIKHSHSFGNDHQAKPQLNICITCLLVTDKFTLCKAQKN